MELTRAEMIDRLWATAEPLFFSPKEVFVAAMEEWNIFSAFKEGELIAILAQRGPHIHFETTSTGKSFPRKDICAIVQRIIDEHGCAVTKTPKHETRQRRFNEAFGFKMVGEDEYDIHYRIERIRGFRRGEPCQS